MRVIGLDPGLRRTGWGVIDAVGARLSHVAHGAIESDDRADVPSRLVQIYEGLSAIIAEYDPAEAAVEETLVNRNASSTLKLGVARGVALLTPALTGLPVAQYLPMIVKKAVVGNGHADKEQVQMMVRRLLPGCEIRSADAADALAVAICHAHNAQSTRQWDAAQTAGIGRKPRAGRRPAAASAAAPTPELAARIAAARARGR